MRDKSKICLPKVCSDWTLDARKIKDTKRLSVVSGNHAGM